MTQLSKLQITAFIEQRLWESMTFEELAKFQVTQETLCVPFGVYRNAAERTLGRPLLNLQLVTGRERVKGELFGGTPPESVREVIDIIPLHKRMILEMAGA